MRMGRIRIWAAAVLLSGLALHGPRGFAEPARDLDRACTAVAALQLPSTQITQAEVIRPQPQYIVRGTEQNPPDRGGPARVTRPFCKVAGVVKPAVRFEVWLPLSDWNGRFQ